MKLRMREAQSSTRLNSFQQAARIWLKQNALKIGYFHSRPITALGAGGRAFKSPRPDHSFQEFRAQYSGLKLRLPASPARTRRMELSLVSKRHERNRAQADRALLRHDGSGRDLDRFIHLVTPAWNSIESVDGDGQLTRVDAAANAKVQHCVLVSFRRQPVLSFPLADAKAAQRTR